MKLRQHDVLLKGQHLVLRALMENDWDKLLLWNNDPEVLYYVEGDVVSARSLEEIQVINRSVSQTAFCFMIEHEGEPVGECWLQAMNLQRILQKYPDADCRRIDLMIGKKELWGSGIGTEVVHLLTTFAFEEEQVDFVFGCDVADYNPASQTVFRNNGYQVSETVPQAAGAKAQYCIDFVLSREAFTNSRS